MSNGCCGSIRISVQPPSGIVVPAVFCLRDCHSVSIRVIGVPLVVAEQVTQRDPVQAVDNLVAVTILIKDRKTKTQCHHWSGWDFIEGLHRFGMFPIGSLRLDKMDREQRLQTVPAVPVTWHSSAFLLLLFAFLFPVGSGLLDLRFRHPHALVARITHALPVKL